MKTLWKTMKDIINVKNNNDVQIKSLLTGKTVTTDAKVIANHLKQYFFSKCCC